MTWVGYVKHVGDQKTMFVQYFGFELALKYIEGKKQMSLCELARNGSSYWNLCFRYWILKPQRCILILISEFVIRKIIKTFQYFIFVNDLYSAGDVAFLWDMEHTADETI